MHRGVHICRRPDAPGATTASGGDSFPVAPSAKIVDTRSVLGISAALGATSTSSFQVLGQGGVPSSGVSAVSVDITAVNATSSGSYLQMYGRQGLDHLRQCQ